MMELSPVRRGGRSDLLPVEVGEVPVLDLELLAGGYELRAHVSVNIPGGASDAAELDPLCEEALGGVVSGQLDVQSSAVHAREQDWPALSGDTPLDLVNDGHCTSIVKTDIGEGSDGDLEDLLGEVGHLLLDEGRIVGRAPAAVTDDLLCQVPASHHPVTSSP